MSEKNQPKPSKITRPRGKLKFGIDLKKVTTSVKITLVVLACAYLTGCRGGNCSPDAKVEYSDKVAAGTVGDYTNADWLYQNYFGDYGLPDNVKPIFMPGLQMLANGFVVQIKTDQDVKTNIEQVHTLFLQYAASGQAKAFFTQVQNEAQNALINQPKRIETQNSEVFQEPVISEEDKKAIEEAKKRDIAEELKIKELADKYQLPYKIDSYKEQWFIYSPTMKGGGKGGGSTQEQGRFFRSLKAIRMFLIGMASWGHGLGKW